MPFSVVSLVGDVMTLRPKEEENHWDETEEYFKEFLKNQETMISMLEDLQVQQEKGMEALAQVVKFEFALEILTVELRHLDKLVLAYKTYAEEHSQKVDELTD